MYADRFPVMGHVLRPADRGDPKPRPHHLSNIETGQISCEGDIRLRQVPGVQKDSRNPSCSRSIPRKVDDLPECRVGPIAGCLDHQVITLVDTSEQDSRCGFASGVHDRNE